MKELNGDIRRFAMINTTDYNSDGRYSIKVVGYDELDGYGWLTDEKYHTLDSMSENKIEDIHIGEIVSSDFIGSYLMRVS